MGEIGCIFTEIVIYPKRTKKEPFQALFKWRRRWDSNPRYAINVRQFSRLLQSTALALLLKSIFSSIGYNYINQKKFNCKVVKKIRLNIA